MWGRLGDVLFQVFVLMALSRTFLFFWIQFNVPFKIISLIETRWGETGVPQENHLTHPQAELGLSHMWPVRRSNLHQAQR